ncbi:MAG: hypothetical protein M3Y69_04445 [Verrucomicrobiota bacterium]|nr:hypothetical protein [Verrucomicrobiota bacterium]
MHLRKLNPTILLALAALILSGSLSALSAATLKLPQDHPVFVIDIPDGWTHETDKNGIFVCTPEPTYSLQIFPLGDGTKTEIKSQLPEAAKSFAEKMKLTDVVIGDVEESKNENKIDFTGLRLDGNAAENKTALVLIFHAFQPTKGKWYVILTVGSEASDKAHDEEYESIYDSIQTLK